MPVALLTDFGERDGYAGVMRLVLSRHFPHVPVIDLSHGIAPGDIRSAAWVLSTAVGYGPEKTVYCAVVDPGVGSDRGILIAEWPTFTVVAPDNGLIGLCKRRFGPPRCQPVEPAAIRAALKMPPAISSTFHGRDLLAPLAGLLASGQKGLLPSASTTTCEATLLPGEKPPRPDADGRYTLRPLHIDHFGNIVLDLHRDELPGDLSNAVLISQDTRIRGLSRTYADVAQGELLLYFGSTGWLEIGVRNGNAAERLGSPKSFVLVP